MRRRGEKSAREMTAAEIIGRGVFGSVPTSRRRRSEEGAVQAGGYQSHSVRYYLKADRGNVFEISLEQSPFEIREHANPTLLGSFLATRDLQIKEIDGRLYFSPNGKDIPLGACQFQIFFSPRVLETVDDKTRLGCEHFLTIERAGHDECNYGFRTYGEAAMANHAPFFLPAIKDFTTFFEGNKTQYAALAKQNVFITPPSDPSELWATIDGSCITPGQAFFFNYSMSYWCEKETTPLMLNKQGDPASIQIKPDLKLTDVALYFIKQCENTVSRLKKGGIGFAVRNQAKRSFYLALWGLEVYATQKNDKWLLNIRKALRPYFDQCIDASKRGALKESMITDFELAYKFMSVFMNQRAVNTVSPRNPPLEQLSGLADKVISMANKQAKQATSVTTRARCSLFSKKALVVATAVAAAAVTAYTMFNC